VTRTPEKGLTLRAVTLRLGARALFPPLDLHIPPARLAAVTGASGVGKSSLLLHLCGLLKPPFAASGTLFLDGESLDRVAPEKRRIGLIFQDALLLPHLTVAENLGFGLPRHRGTSRAARRQKIEEALAQVKLSGFAERDPLTLSGGQRARVALMRTLLAEPRALLLDEPFASLDPPLRSEMRQLVRQQILRHRLPTLLVSHDAADAEELADIAVHLES